MKALRCVNDGTYPCTPEEAIRLAGLQVQAVYGDHNDANHKLGFLTYVFLNDATVARENAYRRQPKP